MVQSTIPTTDALARVLAPVGRCLTPEVARRIAALQADARVRSRIERLARRSTAGTLTADERAEYETCVLAIDILGVLQAQARARLGRGGRS